jgi:hypothetical protein
VSKKAFLVFSVLGALLIFVVSSSYSYYYTLIETDFFSPGHKWDDPDDVPASFLDKPNPVAIISILFILSLYLKDEFFTPSSVFSLPSRLIYPTSLVLRC